MTILNLFLSYYYVFFWEFCSGYNVIMCFLSFFLALLSFVRRLDINPLKLFIIFQMFLLIYHPTKDFNYYLYLTLYFCLRSPEDSLICYLTPYSPYLQIPSGKVGKNNRRSFLTSTNYHFLLLLILIILTVLAKTFIYRYLWCLSWLSYSELLLQQMFPPSP